MGLFNSIRLGSSGAGDYEIERSLRFNDNDSPYLSRQPSSNTSGSSQKITISFWIKLGNIPSGTNGGTFFGTAGDNHRGQFFNQEFYFGNASYWINTTSLVRDPSAWYHVVYVVDTTQGTSTNRQKIYVNGVLQDRGDTINDPSQNAYFDYFNNSSETYYIGRRQSGNYFDGYLAEINFIDGSALTPSSFAETDAVTGEYKPKKYTGGYGTNGFYLNFSDNSNTTAATLGKDSSGNGNNFTPNNFVTGDSVKDSPTNNFCTLNPLNSQNTNLSEGNLKGEITNATGNRTTVATMGVKSGKWYYEVLYNSQSSDSVTIGFGDESYNALHGNNKLFEDHTPSIGYRGNNNIYSNTSTSSTSTTFTSGDIIGVAADLDNNQIYFYKNGTVNSNTNPLSYTFSDTFFIPAITNLTSGGNQTITANFGQDSTFAGAKTAQGNTDANGKGDFYYSPPSGFKAICSANLPDPTIAEGNKHFNALIYTGNDSSDRDITGVGFQPDFLWIKNRQQADWHQLCDAVRGANKVLFSNTNDGEDTDNSNGHVNSFLADGFNVDAGSGGNVNENNENYVAWNWNAGGSTVTNNDGSRTAQVRANTTAGFSIVTSTSGGSSGGTYDSFGHGLGVAPNVIIFKNRDISDNWSIYNSNFSTAYSKILQFNTIVETTSSNHWGTANPTSTTFSLNQGAVFTGASQNLVAYCFSEVAGYSKFGSYIGNNNADGTFVYLGFRPAWVMIKNTEAGSTAWYMLDNKRDPDNPAQEYLAAEDAGGEGTYVFYDFLSNGFKLRNTGPAQNPNGQKVIYMAFAESPFKYARAR